MIVPDEKLHLIIGGAVSTSSMLNSISKIILTLMDLGRSIGSAIRYAKSKIKCG